MWFMADNYSVYTTQEALLQISAAEHVQGNLRREHLPPHPAENSGNSKGRDIACIVRYCA